MSSMKGRLLFTAATVALMLAMVVGYMWVGPGIALTTNSAAAAPVLYDEDGVVAIYESTSPAVVEIKVTERASSLFGSYWQQGQGSGFLIDEQGHILTNNHVVDGASSVQVTLSNGTTLDAQVVGTDPADDLALVQVDASAVVGIAPVPLGDSASVKPGQMAIALGSPFGLDGSITVGVISGLNRTLTSNLGQRMTGLLQTDAAINPGNSGGPLLNSRGEAIGINTAIENPATGANGIGFAVPINTAAKVLPSLLQGQKVNRPWLGISGTAITSDLAQRLGLSIDKGVYVVTVVPDSPAAKAGLKGSGTDLSSKPALGGDIITAVDDRSVGSVDDLVSYFNTKKVGDQVALTIFRNGGTMKVTVILGAWPEKLPSGEQPKATPQPRGVVPWRWQVP